MLRRILVFTAASLALAFAVPAPAHGVYSLVVAHPGSEQGQYTTPIVIAQVGGPLTFMNWDLAAHDVVAVDAYGPDDQPWCKFKPEGECPLFWSPTIPIGQTEVLGLENAASGGVYTFYCTAHPAMRGTLVTV